ncbi:INO80 complex subunit B [Cochliomyia hominivorax]
MGKKEREEKHKKKHKFHKTSKNKTDKSEQSFQDDSVNQHLDSDEIDVEDDRNDTPSNINQESFNNEDENIDIEGEEEIAEDSVDMETNVKEDNVDKTIIVVEKPISAKKSTKKLENTETKTPITPNTSNPKKNKKRRDSGTSSEEERWLTAVESGKLEEIEDVELRKMKDPKLMTARQRAMYDRNNDTESAPGFSETLMALPTGYKEKEKPQTAEELQKAALKILKRKQQADEKREKDKKKTMERLLKKQESKHRAGNKPKAVKGQVPMISYKNTLEGAVIQLPQGIEFPLAAQTPKEPPKPQLCGIQGCDNPKVYNCSKTNLPLCSFACYRKNVQSLKEIIC